jgi:hypothetical protein
MKTRIVQTKFWKDGFVGELTATEKLLFLYFLTNEHINIIHLYECPDRQILFETGVNSDQLQKVKEKLEATGKIFFKDGWIYLKNSSKYEDYKGGLNDKAKENLLRELSPSIREWYENILLNRYPLDTPFKGSINHKSEIRNKKPEIINKKSDEILKSEEMLNHLKETFPMITVSAMSKEIDNMIDWIANAGKKGQKKDYYAFARKWIREKENKLPKKAFKETWKSPVEDINDGKIKKIPAPQPIREIDHKKASAGLEKLSKLREQFKIGEN